jgi:hypothetical protein
MIGMLRNRMVRVIAIPAAALALTAGLGIQAVSAASSAVCGNAGTGYCLNDWGGNGNANDAVKMYYGGTRNDDFYVQDVNRCSGGDKVTTSENLQPDCPFADTQLDAFFQGQTIVQITDTDSETECVGSTGSDNAVLTPCADPLSGSGGGQGVIMVEIPKSTGGDVFLDRFVIDQTSGNNGYLTSGGNPGVQANFNGQTIWGGFQQFGP